MHAKQSRWLNKVQTILCGGVLMAACAMSVQTASAQPDASWTTYASFALANEWAEVDTSTSKTNYFDGYGPTEDKDADGLSNKLEFDGWSTTVNGVLEYYTWNRAIWAAMPPGAVWKGYGPDIDMLVDTDCDGISDKLESNKGGLSLNPQSNDTDGDGLLDSVEVYAGMNPKDDGKVRVGGVVVPDHYTLQYPGLDPDGDGLPTSTELSPANSAVACATVSEPFITTALNASSCTDPLNCDTDGDWLLDSFERTFTFLSATTATDRTADSDADGLSNFREQCIHPLLANYWPLYNGSSNPFSGIPLTRVSSSSTHYSTTRCLVAPGYLQTANFNKAGDVEVYYNAADVQQGTGPGEVTWQGYAFYWTDPGQTSLAWDSDADGMADGWELEHGLNPLNSMGLNGALGDPDLDSIANFQEYFGADGYRVDYRTGTGDETIPWITRSQNSGTMNTAPNGFDATIFVPPAVPPVPPAVAPSFTSIYPVELYPGFFDPTLAAGAPPVFTPVAGTASFPPITDTGVYFDLYGNGLGGFEMASNPGLPADGAGAFQPFLFDGLYYAEDAGNEDGRYTPFIDHLWLGTETFTAVAVPPAVASTLLSTLPAPADGTVGRPLTDNWSMALPMCGYDSDEDGLPDNVEIRMAVSKGKMRTSPVSSQSPLVPRSAKIVAGVGLTQVSPVADEFFARDFTAELWIRVGDGVPTGILAQGLTASGYAAFELGLNAGVPYIAFDTVGGTHRHVVSAARAIQAGRWVHLAGTFDHAANALTLYLNGALEQSEEVGEETAAFPTSERRGSLVFAQSPDFADNLWVDEIRIWKVVRTASEITDNYRHMITSVQPGPVDSYGNQEANGLVAYFTFEDGGYFAESLIKSASCSLLGYSYPHDASVLNFPNGTYIYPEGVFALPTELLNGDFNLDAGEVSPVDGGLDNQRGEWDSDGDKLPDAWELVHEFNPYAFLTPLHAQTPLYDAAWATLAVQGTSTVSDAVGDYDKDGLTNQQEYWAHTNPRKVDTDQDGILDGEEDFDTDGLSNRLEANLGSRPDLSDTDDDGDSDSVEQGAGTSPIDSSSPEKNLALYLDGKEGSYLDIFDQNKLRLASWTLEAKVLPSDLDALVDGQGATIVRRTVQDTDDNQMAANYELRVVRVDDGANSYLTPEIRYVYVDDSRMGQSVSIRGSPVANESHRIKVAASVNDPYPTKGLTHLAGTYDGTTGGLRLYLDGVLLTNQTFSSQSRPPQSGKGARSFVRIGEGFAGFVDDVRIWSGVCSKDEINENMASVEVSSATNLIALYTMNDGGFPVILSKPSVLQTLTTPPPVAPTLGDRYLVGIGGTGEWAGKDNNLVEFTGSTWSNTPPVEGMRVLDVSVGNVLEFTAGVWGAVAGDPELVVGVDYAAEPLPALKMDGVSWYVAPSIVKISSGLQVTSAAPANVFCEGAMVAGAAVPGGLHWWASRSVYYRSLGGQWVEWGPSVYNLSPVRLKVDNVYANNGQMTAVTNRVVGETFLVTDDAAIYTVMSTDGSTLSSYLSEPVNENDRILVPMAPYSGVVVWQAGAPVVLATPSTFGGDLHVFVRSEGVAYKSDGAVWRRWSMVPTLEDSTEKRDWENQWRHASRMSGFGSLRQMGGVVRSPRDNDGDGLADDWEVAHSLDPCDSGIVGATNICTGAAITNTLNGADGDPDGDGLINKYEYLLGYDPWLVDTDGNGLNDGDEDYDGDGLGNLEEINKYGTDPASADTDDDGFLDNQEIMRNTSALYSRSPLVGRSMVMNGVPVAVPEPRKVTDGVRGPQRFQALERWYLAAMVRPDAAQTGSLIRRNVPGNVPGALTHFELGLANNIPFVRFNDSKGTMYTASGTAALPTDRFSELIAEWSPSNHVLKLSVDGCVVGAENVMAVCARGPGQTVIGDGVRGRIDDVFIGPNLLGGATPSPDYVLMIDVSGSMAIDDRIGQAKTAALTMIATMPKGSSMAIVTFDHQVERVQEFTTDRDVLNSVVNSLAPLGATSYSAPVTKMIELISDRAALGGYVGILISDGEPNSGVPTDADLAQVVALGAKINSVGFGSSILAGSTYELARVAQNTGGTFYPAPGGAELAQILSTIVTEEKADDSCFYPFDDGAMYAEDYKHLLEWDYALEGVTFDAAAGRFSTAITPFNYAFVDFEDETPQWWLDWFLKDSDATAPTNDPDQDGLNNLNEWRVTFLNQASALPALSPLLADSNGNGSSDGEEDNDGDTLIGKDEQATHGCRVDRLDTDDDGLNDNQEVRTATDPDYSMIPYVMRAMQFGASGGTGEVLVEDRVRGVDTEHLSAKDWTVECLVQPSAVPSVGVDQPLIQRRLRCSDLINYELGIRNNGSGQIIPYVRFNHYLDGNLLELSTGLTLATNEWSHLAGRLSDGALTLFINGQEVRSISTSYDPAQGAGDATFGGNGFVGRLKEVRIWKVGRRSTDIRDFRQRSLVFGTPAADPGLLRVSGDLGHLREVAAPGTSRDELRTWTLETWVRTKDTAGTILARVNTGNVAEETDDFNYFMGVDQSGRLVGKFAIQYREVTQNTNGTSTISELKFNTSANTLVSSRTINDGEWHHVAYTRDADYAVLYIDGELAGIQAGYLLPGGIASSLQDEDIRILSGPVELGRNLAGDIDEARIWGRALGVDEVKSVMKQNLFGNEKSLVSYFSFDFQQGVHAEDRAAIRNPDSEYGTYIPGAELVRTTDQAPIENFFPLRVYAFTSLLGYYPADDGGSSLENLLYQNNWSYAGKLSGDVQFEVLATTNQPFAADSDRDGLPDWWETLMGLNPGSDRDSEGAYGDKDNDGLNNWAEWLAGTNPTQFDTDGDGHSDYESPGVGGTFGSLYMDGDDIPDDWEMIYPTALSPLRYDANLDPDGDGWDNRSEYLGSGFEFVSSETSSNASEVIRYYKAVSPTKPDDANTFPVPTITFTFLGECTPAVGKPLVVYAFSDPSMSRPDAVHTVSNRFVNGLTETVSLWNGGNTKDVGDGHVRQGPNIFMAFIDDNTDGKWNAGEWMGYSENGTENISWGSANVRIGLTDKPAGYIRFSWEPDMTAIAAALSQVNGTTYLVAVKPVLGSTNIYSTTRSLESMNRSYITEMDLKQAGVAPLFGAYQWSVGTADGVTFATGTNSLVQPAALVAPVIQSPVGNLDYALEKLRMTLDPYTAQIQIQIQNAVTSATLLNVTRYAPFINVDGTAELDLPALAGFGSLTNGSYKIQVRAFNPRATASSAWMNFSIDIKTPASGGAAMISGQVNYFGWATNANVVVEAFEGGGFDQAAVARVKADTNLNYRLMGLRAGLDQGYYVRAYHDLNANSVLDAGEAWGLVKGSRDSVTAPAPSLYAVDYSVRRIETRNNVSYRKATVNSGNNIIIHDEDSDKDGLPDMWELRFAGNLTSMNLYTDSDNDGFLDVENFRYGTDPKKTDTDGDALPDKWEVQNGLNPLSALGDDGTKGDPDHDGVWNTWELAYGTDPWNPDTDGDGLTDWKEPNDTKTNPLSPDTDGDTLPDGWEVGYGLSPTNTATTNGATGDIEPDDLNNAQEYAAGTNPKVADTDGDGLSDGTEVLIAHTDPLVPDTDHDGYLDGVEYTKSASGYDPLDPTKPRLIVPPSFQKAVFSTNASQLSLSYEVLGATPRVIVVESRTNLLKGAWTAEEIRTNVTKYGVYTNVITVAPGTTNRFYRIRNMLP